jgi:hypothetical protein
MWAGKDAYQIMGATDPKAQFDSGDHSVNSSRSMARWTLHCLAFLALPLAFVADRQFGISAVIGF